MQEPLAELLQLPAPWTMQHTELRQSMRCLDIWVTATPRSSWPCPACGVPSPTDGHTTDRIWRHLDSCDLRTYLHANLPYILCRTHGPLELRVPWADSDSCFTKQFERLVVGILDECKVRGAQTVLGLTSEEAQDIRGRAMRRREARKRASFLEYQGASDMLSYIHDEADSFARVNGNGVGSTCARRRLM
jgi:transposase